VVAGSCYPGDAESFCETISKYLKNAKIIDVNGEIIVLILLNTGYAYSGYTAANSYKQVKGNRYDVVIVLAPSRHETFSGVFVFNNDGYETPLGIVPAEKTIANAIIDKHENIRFT